LANQPSVWFHDLLHTDGTPYDQDEVRLIRQIAGVKPKAQAAGA
jgi:hypothetical protein